MPRALAIAALLLALGGALCPSAAAEPARRALLIGVTAYDNPAIGDLRGPRNDALMLARALAPFGFAGERVTILAESPGVGPTLAPGVPASLLDRIAGPPTRAAILGALDDLAATAGPGDVVLVFFAGHGTTQPVTDADAQRELEAGGRDQVLLPMDAAGFDPATGTIAGGIVDDFLGAQLDAIRAKGAHVVAIFDACHAGTVTRGEAVARGVDPGVLGAPEAAPAGRRVVSPAIAQAASSDAGSGSLVAFFAVDPFTEAIERPHPALNEGGEVWTGVFSRALVETLSSRRGGDYRTLARGVAAALGREALQAPQPMFEGALDRPLFEAGAAGPRRFAVTRDETGALRLEAGALEGAAEGAIVAIHAGPGEDGPPLGHAVVTAAGWEAAAIEPDPGLALPEGPLLGELRQPPLSLDLPVGPIEGPEAAAVAPLLEAALERAAAAGAGLRAAGPGDAGGGALRPVAEAGRLWFVADGRPLVPAGVPGETPSVAIGDDREATIEAIDQGLRRLRRARGLVRIAAAAADAPEAPLEIAVSVVGETDPARLADPKRACGDLSMPSDPRPVDPALGGALTHCDEIRVTLTNLGERTIDVGLFYLDAKAGVTLFDRSTEADGCVIAMPGSTAESLALPRNRPFRVITWSARRNAPAPVGIERLLVFAEVRAGPDRPWLCHLVQPTVTPGPATRAGGPGRLSALLDAAGGAGPVRGADPGAALIAEEGEALARAIPFDVRPPAP